MSQPDERGERKARNERSDHFLLNVDLDIDSPDDLKPLVEAFEPSAFALERPAGRASFELNEPVAPQDPEPLILEFVRLVTNLPPAARNV